MATMEHLQLPRKPLYEHTNEDQALVSADSELIRRDDAETALRHKKKLRATMVASKGPDWARILLRGEKGAKLESLGDSRDVSTHPQRGTSTWRTTLLEQMRCLRLRKAMSSTKNKSNRIL
jgi:hypothetical protein